MLAYAIHNEWGTPLVILSLIVIGLGEGSSLTLMFNMLVSSSPKELAGDVGALRGTTNNLSTALGTALLTLFAVNVLSAIIAGNLAGNPAIPPELKAQIPLDKVDFVRNNDLAMAMSAATATPEQVAGAVGINAAARLQALKDSDRKSVV